jgi:hypothetical protein|uniref:Uncharacterized protein n=1 Tax=Desulfobacca acetoxidans TaxID=60893 RepID=A0A7C3SJM5_9BACT
MASPVIIRRHDGAQSYLVLDEKPRELLFHWGFKDAYSVRPWLGSRDPVEALEEWAEMLAEDPQNYMITDENHWEYQKDLQNWVELLKSFGL